MLGGDRRSRDFSAYQNGTLKTTREIKDGTKGRIGKEYGISTNAVVRAEQFAHSIDTIRTVSSETADDILNGKIKTIFSLK